MTLPIFPVLPGLTFTTLKTPTFKTMVSSAPNAYEVRLQQSINPVWEYTLIFDFLHDFLWSGFTTVSELRTLMGFFLQVGGQAGSFLYTDPDDNYVGPALLPATTTPNVPLAQLQLVNDGAGNYYSPIQRTLNGVFYEDVTDLNGGITVYANGTIAADGILPGQYEVMGPGLALPTSSYLGLYLKWGIAAPAWQASSAYLINAEILDPAGHIQKVTTAGTSGASIPNFNDSGGTTTDNTITWTDQGAYAGPAGPITAQFNFYFRVRFETDSQDFEKFTSVGTNVIQYAGQGGGNWTVGGSESVNGSGQLKLVTARPDPLD